MIYIVLWASGDTTKVIFKDEIERDNFIKVNSFLRRKDGVLKMKKIKD